MLPVLLCFHVAYFTLMFHITINIMRRPNPQESFAWKSSVVTTIFWFLSTQNRVRTQRENWFNAEIQTSQETFWIIHCVNSFCNDRYGIKVCTDGFTTINVTVEKDASGDHLKSAPSSSPYLARVSRAKLLSHFTLFLGY